MRKLAVLLAFLMLVSVFCPLAVFAEDNDTVTITFTLIDKYDEGFAFETGPYEPRTTTVECTFPRGHTLTDDDIPKYSSLRIGGLPHENYEDEPDWEPFKPQGYTVTEDMTFIETPIATGLYFVEFIDYDHDRLRTIDDLHKGDVIPLPEAPEEKKGVVFIRWNRGENGYLTITGNMGVFAIRYGIGNMNGDEDGYYRDIIDVADATLILRGLVNPENNPEYFDRLADVNQNGKADPADATLILRRCVGAEN